MVHTHSMLKLGNYPDWACENGIENSRGCLGRGVKGRGRGGGGQRPRLRIKRSGLQITATAQFVLDRLLYLFGLCQRTLEENPFSATWGRGRGQA